MPRYQRRKRRFHHVLRRFKEGFGLVLMPEKVILMITPVENSRVRTIRLMIWTLWSSKCSLQDCGWQYLYGNQVYSGSQTIKAYNTFLHSKDIKMTDRDMVRRNVIRDYDRLIRYTRGKPMSLLGCCLSRKDENRLLRANVVEKRLKIRGDLESRPRKSGTPCGWESRMLAMAGVGLIYILWRFADGDLGRASGLLYQQATVMELGNLTIDYVTEASKTSELNPGPELFRNIMRKSSRSSQDASALSDRRRVMPDLKVGDAVPLDGLVLMDKASFCEEPLENVGREVNGDASSGSISTKFDGTSQEKCPAFT
ncbi:hypothetical protein Tco_1245246 [Tanacetum coccineum]